MTDERPMDADLPEADLIELVLRSRAQEAHGAHGPESFAALDAADRARALELRGFLDGCRAALTAEPTSRVAGTSGAPDPVAALTERVLAATTREDLSWRGDLRLVGGFVVQRLRHSRMLRIAAVVLAMHFVGLSVLAYHLLRQPREPFINVDFEDRPVLPYPEVVREPAGELSLPEAGDEPRVREVGGVLGEGEEAAVDDPGGER